MMELLWSPKMKPLEALSPLRKPKSFWPPKKMQTQTQQPPLRRVGTWMTCWSWYSSWMCGESVMLRVLNRAAWRRSLKQTRKFWRWSLQVTQKWITCFLVEWVQTYTRDNLDPIHVHKVFIFWLVYYFFFGLTDLSVLYTCLPDLVHWWGCGPREVVSSRMIA